MWLHMDEIILKIPLVCSDKKRAKKAEKKSWKKPKTPQAGLEEPRHLLVQAKYVIVVPTWVRFNCDFFYFYYLRADLFL